LDINGSITELNVLNNPQIFALALLLDRFYEKDISILDDFVLNLDKSSIDDVLPEDYKNFLEDVLNNVSTVNDLSLIQQAVEVALSSNDSGLVKEVVEANDTKTKAKILLSNYLESISSLLSNYNIPVSTNFDAVLVAESLYDTYNIVDIKSLNEVYDIKDLNVSGVDVSKIVGYYFNLKRAPLMVKELSNIEYLTSLNPNDVWFQLDSGERIPLPAGLVEYKDDPDLYFDYNNTFVWYDGATITVYNVKNDKKDYYNNIQYFVAHNGVVTLDDVFDTIRYPLSVSNFDTNCSYDVLTFFKEEVLATYSNVSIYDGGKALKLSDNVYFIYTRDDFDYPSGFLVTLNSDNKVVNVKYVKLRKHI
jgi:hypothetical protein